jgi:cation diffusion facilitator family transporter
LDDSYYTTVKRVLLLVLFLNLAVSLAKLLYGWRTNSLSMVSDGFHSLFDATSNVIGVVGIILASRPPDPSHPYGHSKFETFSSLGIVVLLFVTCFEILKSAWDRFLNPTVPEITILSFLVMGVTIAVNITVSYYENRKGRELGSGILIADSMHTRSDIYSSLVVIGGFVLIWLGFTLVDPLISLIIVVLIARMGIQIIKESSDVLLDQAPLDEKRIRKEVCQLPEVKDCHRIRSRGVVSQIYVDLHITLEGCYSVNEAHRIAHQVEDKLKASIPGVKDVVVHVDPCED